MATLSFKNINKIYDNHVQAVFDFNLEVKDKEFIVFVGPSGCGKSTTLRMVAGLEDITSGQLLIDGVYVNNVVPKDRNIAMVFQSYALYPHMSVYNNMAFALKLRKVRMPLYLPNPECDAIREENKQLFKAIKKLNRQIKKKNEPKELVNERDNIFEKIYNNEEKRKSLLVQQTGISQLDIKECTKLIDMLKYEIELYNKKIVHLNKKLDQYTARKEALSANENIDNEKKNKRLEELTNEINKITNHINIISDSIEQKKNQLTVTETTLNHFKNNEVPLEELRKHTAYEIALEVYKAARTLGLTKYLLRKPAALSGGQRQRVALGRAIVRHPKVFLMDEPLSNLDAKLRVQMRNEISKIHESVGATTIYVTHDQTEAMTMANRIVIMKDGYIQQIGTPKEVYNDPSNMFVAGFIGSPAMNFIKGKLVGHNFVIDGEKPINIKLSKKDVDLLSSYQDKELYLGVRPESIFLKDDVNNTNPTNSIKLQCDFAEMLGYELLLYTYINGQKVIVKTSTKADIKTHDFMEIAFNNDMIYFFDSETTNRIK